MKSSALIYLLLLPIFCIGQPPVVPPEVDTCTLYYGLPHEPITNLVFAFTYYRDRNGLTTNGFIPQFVVGSNYVAFGLSTDTRLKWDGGTCTSYWPILPASRYGIRISRQALNPIANKGGAP